MRPRYNKNEPAELVRGRTVFQFDLAHGTMSAFTLSRNGHTRHRWTWNRNQRMLGLGISTEAEAKAYAEKFLPRRSPSQAMRVVPEPTYNHGNIVSFRFV